jgi:DNA topoisomerase-1
MEQLSLGTKSTRHEIINKLFLRKYITLSPLAPTPIATAVIDALEDCDVVKPKMTATLEEDMDLISEGKKTLDETVNESRQMLTGVMSSLEKDKEKIRVSIKKAQMKQNTVGKCNKCGKPLIIRTSKRNKRFVGCTGYPDCKNTFSLPQKGGIIVSEKVCEDCGAPIVKIKSKGKGAWKLCINNECSSNKPSAKK